MSAPKSIRWTGDRSGTLTLLDQTRLPTEEVFLECTTAEHVWDAIKRLAVRGAPAIGVSAAYGVVLGVRDAAGGNRAAFDAKLAAVCDYLAGSRPTAVNLFWAIERLKRVAAENADLDPAAMTDRLLEEARTIEAEDREMCAAIGRHGVDLLPAGRGVLTHCNTGALATAGDGTALSVIFAAQAAGKDIHVYADETRPLLQGARLTTWECISRDVPVTLICDSAAAQVMKEGRIGAVIVGADRIAANGDAANKIGTYSVATCAKAHGVPFYVAAPTSTFDLSLPDGTSIPIEERSPEEVTEGFGKRTAPAGVDVYSPAFDVTPARLIAGIVTEKGVIAPVTTEAVAAVVGS
ncbi:MAG: S-methyl-5-thioribose-1-phosphate isomerase [Planctomycetota bacterium]